MRQVLGSIGRYHVIDQYQFEFPAPQEGLRRSELGSFGGRVGLWGSREGGKGREEGGNGVGREPRVYIV